jgi:hypothetical protein
LHGERNDFAIQRRWLQRHPRFVLHFTPISASWLNQVERFFAEITEKRIRRGAFQNVNALESAYHSTWMRTTKTLSLLPGPQPSI